MSEEQRANLISLVTNLLVTIPYFFYIFQKYSNGEFGPDGEFKFWVSAVLLLIPIRVVAQIIIYIAAMIVAAIVTGKEPQEGINDERDTIISLKANRNSYYIFVFGFILALLSGYQTNSLSAFFSIFLVTGFVSELIEIGSKLYFYNRGY